jgi:peptidoglycan/xylan/chitin deacetylase (PgdA/CDA1 family)
MTCSPQRTAPNETKIFSELTAFDAQFYKRTYRSIALTFDDGPHPVHTLSVLKVLRDYNLSAAESQRARATFFVTGTQAQAHPDLLQRIVAEGHLLASHGYYHDNMTKKTDAQLLSQVLDVDSLIRPVKAKADLTMPGKQNLYFFRAPYGAWGTCLAKQLNENPETARYIGPIFWHVGGALEKDSQGNLVNAADWSCAAQGLSVNQCISAYREGIRRREGGIVLMHDVQALAAAITANLLTELGDEFKFIGLDEIKNVEEFSDLPFDGAGDSCKKPVTPGSLNPCQSTWNPNLHTCLNAAKTSYCDPKKGDVCAQSACYQHVEVPCPRGCSPQSFGTSDLCLQ